MLIQNLITLQDLYVCLYVCLNELYNVCMYVCMYVCMNYVMYVCMFECMYVYVNVCMDVFMIVFMYDVCVPFLACVHACMYICMLVCVYVYVLYHQQCYLPFRLVNDSHATCTRMIQHRSTRLTNVCYLLLLTGFSLVNANPATPAASASSFSAAPAFSTSATNRAPLNSGMPRTARVSSGVDTTSGTDVSSMVSYSSMSNPPPGNSVSNTATGSSKANTTPARSTSSTVRGNSIIPTAPASSTSTAALGNSVVPTTPLGNSVVPTTPDNAEFMRRLMRDHRRYCGRQGVCLERWPDRCYKCEPCQCDDVCSLYDDCCPDVLTRRSNTTVSAHHLLPRECVSGVSRMYGDRVDNVTARATGVRKYFMVTSCNDDALSRLCTDSEMLPPVSAMVDNVTFLNKHCAECHNVTRYLPWDVKIDCNEKFNFSTFRTTLQLLKASLDEDMCTVYYHPPNGVIARECFYDDNVISKCNITGMWPEYDAFTKRACETFTTVKIVEGRRYRNPFCFICNSDSYRKLFSRCKRKLAGGPVAFSALLDFSDVFRSTTKDPTTQCEEDNIYDAEKVITSLTVTI